MYDFKRSNSDIDECLVISLLETTVRHSDTPVRRIMSPQTIKMSDVTIDVIMTKAIRRQ